MGTMKDKIPKLDCKDSIIAKNITFESLAKLLERVSTTPTSRRKLLELNKFYTFVRQNFKNHYGTLDASKADGDSIYSLARILLPVQDRERAAYGFQAPTLGRVFYEILGVGDKTKDAEKLLRFKETDANSGDFPTVVADVIRNRTAKPPKIRPTLADLHEVLEKLEKFDPKKPGVTLDQQKRALHKFVLSLTPLEGKWLALILLKQLGLGLTTGQLFSCIHDKAGEYYTQNRNLETVCRALNDPRAMLDSSSIQLFLPFKQMLCARLNLLDIGTGRTDEDKHNRLALPAPPFLIETKVDGERFEIHYDSSRIFEDQFRMFGRSGVDYTQSFVRSFTPRLRAQIKPSCKSFILDGEMMMFQRSTNSFCQKGGRIDVRNLSPDDPDLNPAFVAFDVVYYNGRTLTGLIIEERLDILDHKIFVPKDGVVYASKRTLARSKEQVEEALNEAVGRCEEGLIVKELGSVYKVGKRDPVWMKIKPELIESTMIEDMDMIILGGYFTKSFKERGINRFLVGLLDDSKPPGKEIFYPVCTVGQGKVKQAEWRALIKELEPKFIKRDNPTFHVNWKTSGRPDVLINPKKSVVLQVKAAEIVWSDTMELNYTLRFARTIRIRRDKTWREVVTLKEFHDIRITSGGKLARRSDNLPKDDDKVEFYVPPLRSKGPVERKYDEFSLTPPDEEPTWMSAIELPVKPAKPARRVYEKKKKRPIEFKEATPPPLRYTTPEPEVKSQNSSVNDLTPPHDIPPTQNSGNTLAKVSHGPQGPVRPMIPPLEEPSVDKNGHQRPGFNLRFPEVPHGIKTPNAQSSLFKPMKPMKRKGLFKKPPAKTPKLSNTFQNQVYYLVGSEDWKRQVGSLIVDHGGTLVASTVKADKLSGVIAETLSARAKDLGEGKQVDVLKSDWIDKCIAAGRIVDIQPDDCWIAGSETAGKISEDFDVYGNSYTKPMTTLDMKKLLGHVMSLMDKGIVK